MGFERHGKEQLDGETELEEFGVTVNPKSISRRTFRQLIHRQFGYNFLDFFVATLRLIEIAGKSRKDA